MPDSSLDFALVTEYTLATLHDDVYPLSHFLFLVALRYDGCRTKQDQVVVRIINELTDSLISWINQGPVTASVVLPASSLTEWTRDFYEVRGFLPHSDFSVLRRMGDPFL